MLNQNFNSLNKKIDLLNEKFDAKFDEIDSKFDLLNEKFDEIDSKFDARFNTIENNIKLHFIKYLNRFVNSSYKKQNNELLEKCEKGTKTKLRKELNKNLYEIKEDLINNTLNSNNK